MPRCRMHSARRLLQARDSGHLSDIETLRTVNETLIRTVEEVREIHREGMAKRKQLSTELVDMREDLEKRLALPTAGNATQ